MNLDWLMPVADWRARIGALGAEGHTKRWRDLVGLANHRLSLSQAERIAAAMDMWFPQPPDEVAAPIELLMLGSATVGHLVAPVRAALLRRGLWSRVTLTDYGQYRHCLMSRSMPGRPEAAPSCCLFALDARHLLGGIDPLLDEAGAAAAAAAVINDLSALWRLARDWCRGPVLQQALLPLFPVLVGSNEHRLPGAPAAMALRLNALLREAADREGVDIVAVDAAAARDGIAPWTDPRLWYRAKQEITPSAAPAFGELVARLLAARQGRSAKCLVLDLDNTLWGGVIGDDGVDGIAIGQGTAEGESFAAFQSYCRDLKARGILLAVCSKNDEAVALGAFDHPDMVLRRSDFAAFIANWEDKATNLRRIAQDLGIGLDALVFVDDNPFERNLVRQELAMVAVPELPDDPAGYARRVSEAGYFEAVALTDDDRARAAQYAANRARQAEAAATTDMAGYLASLDMRLRWKPVDRQGLPRVVQLIGKTNQFNLTTRRHSLEEVAAMSADPRAIVLQFRLADRFGDNGIVAVVIGQPAVEEATVLDIDTWLMSCRVLGRRVEEAVLAVLADHALEAGYRLLHGHYRPTERNGMVADLLPRLGFVRLEQENRFELRLPTSPSVNDLPFVIERD